MLRSALAQRREVFESAGRVTCPCCGYPTIPERAGYDICSLCAWEDDGQDDPGTLGNESPAAAPDVVVGGPNHDYSLREARDNFEANLTSYRPSDIDFESERVSTSIKRDIVAAYERAVSGLTDVERAEDDARYLFAKLYGIG